MHFHKEPVNVEKFIEAMEETIVMYKTYTKSRDVACLLCRASCSYELFPIKHCDICAWEVITNDVCCSFVHRSYPVRKVAGAIVCRFNKLRLLFDKPVRKRIKELDWWVKLYKAWAFMDFMKDLEWFNTLPMGSVEFLAEGYDHEKSRRKSQNGS